MHELTGLAVVELHVNATYYAQQHPALGSFYGKGQSVISGTGSSWDFKTSDLNYFYEALVQIEAFTIICQDRVFASFLCALSLSSVLGRFIHLYWTIPEKQTGGGGYRISKGIEEMASGFSGV